MRVLVVGGGGREHALVHAFAASPLLSAQFCAPGNAGIAAEADCIGLASDDVGGLLAFAKKERIDLTVIGPEAPLVAGLADALTENGMLAFGPSKIAAQMEGSKAFAKDVMWDAKAPSARFRRHDNLDDALRCLEMQDSFPLVVKADGLAAGKGVVIAADFDEARTAVEDNLIRRQYGAASDEVIIEEYLAGPEVSLLALCDGTIVVPMAPAQDYKRIFAGDEGPNTGGMGSYCPVPGFSEAVTQHVIEKVFEPVLSVLQARGIHYRGVLYGGLIATSTGIKVLEFNCRFGDPETQAILPRLQSDLLETCLATARGELAGVKLDWKPQACVSVVMASGRLPGRQPQGRHHPRPGAGGRRARRGRLSRRHRLRAGYGRRCRPEDRGHQRGPRAGGQCAGEHHVHGRALFPEVAHRVHERGLVIGDVRVEHAASRLAHREPD